MRSCLRLVVVLATLAGGCGEQHALQADAGATEAGPTLGPLTCQEAMSDADRANGASCDPATFGPCTNYYDGWMGLCGSVRVTCVEGIVSYVDATFPCSPPDAGPPVTCGGTTCSIGDVCVQSCSGVDAGPATPSASHCAPRPTGNDCTGPVDPHVLAPACSVCGPGYGTYTDGAHIRCAGCA